MGGPPYFVRGSDPEGWLYEVEVHGTTVGTDVDGRTVIQIIGEHFPSARGRSYDLMRSARRAAVQAIEDYR